VYHSTWKTNLNIKESLSATLEIRKPVLDQVKDPQRSLLAPAVCEHQHRLQRAIIMIHQSIWNTTAVAVIIYRPCRLLKCAQDPPAWSHNLLENVLLKVFRPQILHQSGPDRVERVRNVLRMAAGVEGQQNFAAMHVVTAERRSARGEIATGHGNRVGKGGIDVVWHMGSYGIRNCASISVVICIFLRLQH
jgi:hypothetical protein